MDSVIDRKLKEYNPLNQDDYKNALKEMLQNIILAALNKSNFFKVAAFYGGTALRIFYGLDRFSEDLDFTLLTTNNDFSFEPYFDGIKKTMESYGFVVETKSVIKNQDHQNISSAFLKAGTKVTILSCKAPKEIYQHLSDFDNLKIKFEADIEPPLGFYTQELGLDFPDGSKIKVLDLPSLLAGKIHAILYRSYKNRVKGRDYYDFEFLVNKNTSVNLSYLKNKIKNSDSSIDVNKLSIEDIKKMLLDKINMIDWNQANEDLENFVDNKTLEPILKKENIVNSILKLN